MEEKATRWVTDHAGSFNSDPVFPAGLSDRAQDCWEPLLVVGELIGRGWPERIRGAAVALANQEGSGEAQDRGGMLLEDLVALIERGKVEEEIGTRDLLHELLQLDERPWPHLNNGKGLNAKTLADLTKGFDIRPDKIGDRSSRGYTREDIDEAIERWR